MMLSNALVLITGCGGFIGSRLLSSLVKERINVLGVDKDTGNLDQENVNFLNLDLLKESGAYDKLSSYLKKAQNIFIVHLAGMPGVGQCRKNREIAYDVNVKSLQKVCEIAQSYRVKKIIFASSYLIYGNKPETLIDEDCLPSPGSVYAETKLEAENYLLNNFRNTAIMPVILRLSNVYGPGMKKDTIIPTICEQLNNDYINLREYESVRDYIYIEDVIRALKYVLFNRCGFNIYNVGTSVGYSVFDLVKTVAEVMGRDKLVEGLKVKKERDNRLVLSYKRINKDTGWEPVYSLKEGIGLICQKEK